MDDLLDDNAPRGRPSLLLLGDSRSRWFAMHMASEMCDRRLRNLFDGGAPRAINSTRALDRLLDGVDNWRSGGGFACSNDSALSSLGYYVHYGVSADPPYSKNPGTWHHANDFENASLSST